MDNKQDPEASGDRADAVPTFLAVLVPAKDEGMQWVREYNLGKREIQAMLRPVPSLLAGIPCEPHSRLPILYMQN